MAYLYSDPLLIEITERGNKKVLEDFNQPLETD